MSLLSTRQKDSDQLMSEWSLAEIEARCPLMHHEYCADSKKGRARKLPTIRDKQQRSNNRKADRASRHNMGFEHPYDLTTMQAESKQIADYVVSVNKKPKKAKWVKREKPTK